MKLPLLISGNKESNSGYQPIVILNNYPGDLRDRVYEGVKDNNSFFYTVQILKSYTTITLVKNHVTSFQANRMGSLSVSVAIPKGCAVSESPARILREVLEAYCSHYMTASGINDAYQFKMDKEDDNVFKAIIDKYDVLEHRLPHRPMQGNGCAYIQTSKEKIDALLADVQYPEFSVFSELIIAENVGPTNYTSLSNIQIPRPRTFRLFVDNQQKDVVAIDTPIQIKPNISNPECYEGNPYSFSVKELMQGKVLPLVGVDLEAETVHCKSDIKPRHVHCRLDIEPVQYEKQILLHKDLLSIRLNGRIKALDENLNFELVGEEIAMTASLRVEYRGHDARVSHATYENGNLRIQMKKISQQDENTAQGNNNGLTIEIFIHPFLQPSYDIEDIHLKIRAISDSRLYWKSIVHITSQQDGGKNVVKGKVLLTSEWQNKEIIISAESDDYTYDGCCLTLKKGTNHVELSPQKKTFFSKIQKVLKWAILLLLLTLSFIGGCVAGFFSHDAITGHRREAGVSKDSIVQDTATLLGEGQIVQDTSKTENGRTYNPLVETNGKPQVSMPKEEATGDNTGAYGKATAQTQKGVETTIPPSNPLPNDTTAH